MVNYHFAQIMVLKLPYKYPTSKNWEVPKQQRVLNKMTSAGMPQSYRCA